MTDMTDRRPKNDGATIRLRDEALDWRAVDGEVVALDFESGVYLAATRSGALMWERRDSGSTVDELSRCLVDAFGIPNDVASADVRDFVAEMAAHRLLSA
jgi:hypothetical protein